MRMLCLIFTRSTSPDSSAMMPSKGGGSATEKQTRFTSPCKKSRERNRRVQAVEDSQRLPQRRHFVVPGARLPAGG